MASEKWKNTVCRAKEYLSMRFYENRKCILSPETAIVLGTGWGNVLMEKMPEALKIPFSQVPGFEYLEKMGEIAGHAREVVMDDLLVNPYPHTRSRLHEVIMLRGRIHLNEDFDFGQVSKMVRLQIEMLLKLGVKNLILTNAAGSLRPEVKVGDIVAHDGFITLFAPKRPLTSGEFVSPEDMLKEANIREIEECAQKVGLNCHRGAGAMVSGPDFEGRKHDKRIMREFGATMAMMSILPEVAVAALYPRTNVYAISFITNTDSEEHSHEDNQVRAKASADKLGALLLNLIISL